MEFAHGINLSIVHRSLLTRPAGCQRYVGGHPKHNPADRAQGRIGVTCTGVQRSTSPTDTRLESVRCGTVMHAKCCPMVSFLPATNVLLRSATPDSFLPLQNKWKPRTSGRTCSARRRSPGTHCPVSWLPDGCSRTKRFRDQHRFKFDHPKLLGPGGTRPTIPVLQRSGMRTTQAEGGGQSAHSCRIPPSFAGDIHYSRLLETLHPWIDQLLVPRPESGARSPPTLVRPDLSYMTPKYRTHRCVTRTRSVGISSLR